MPGERKRKAEERNPPAEGAPNCALPDHAPTLRRTSHRGNRATGLARCASNVAVLYFSRRRPRGLSASGFFILVALPVPGKVYFYRAEIQVGTDLDRPDCSQSMESPPQNACRTRHLEVRFTHDSPRPPRP